MLRDLTDNCMCGVQRWGSHSWIMLNTIISSSFQFAAASDWNWLLWLLRVMYCCLYLLAFVLLSVPIMFVPCFVLLPCCAAAMMCCCHVVLLPCCCYVVLLPCYVVVLGLSLCSGVVSLLSWCVLSYIFMSNASPHPRRRPFASW